MHAFTPGPDTVRELRHALGQFATGVTVMTCDSDIGPLGMTANSFSSVSLDPPLILWSPARASRRFPAFASATRFAVHVLGAEQRDLCARFSRQGTDFDGLEWRVTGDGVPLIDGCLAQFLCHSRTTYDGGDHAIVVGEVETAHWHTGAPLVFSAGHYGGFVPAHIPDGAP